MVLVIVVAGGWDRFLEFPVLVCNVRYGEFHDENTSKWKLACVACRDG